MSPSSSDQGLVPGHICLLSLPILVQHFSVVTDGSIKDWLTQGGGLASPLWSSHQDSPR